MSVEYKRIQDLNEYCHVVDFSLLIHFAQNDDKAEPSLWESNGENKQQVANLGTTFRGKYRWTLDKDVKRVHL